ncbi:MAG: fumarylacetoacetate hydrolase family protein [Deltaproteobacteria bacterium]|nr:fumarylacetoacetate hydrolase family protein [Deltaproteobacteria bacterium]
MKFLTFSSKDATRRAGVLSRDEKRVLCLTHAQKHFGDAGIPASILEIVQQGDALLPAVNSLLEKAEAVGGGQAFLPLDQVTLHAPYNNPPRNIFCVGLNYRDHALEFEQTNDSSKAVPQFPIIFTKPNTTIADPDTAVDGHFTESESYDYEVELAVVIGRTGKNIPKEKAYEHVFGYSVINDLTARDLQRRTSQWYSGKCLDESAPFGPYLAHKSAVPDPQSLDLRCSINGELRQDSNTRLMMFDIPTIIATLSKGSTLMAGDIIATGTCSGVGMSFDPPKFLKQGDKIEMTIQSVGTLRNTIR